MPPTSLHPYSHSQLSAFFDHIRLPPSHRIFDITSQSLDSVSTLRYLALLQKLTLITLPFENLSLHYSESRNVDIDPQVLWDKVVGRGLREQAADDGKELLGHVIMQETQKSHGDNGETGSEKASQKKRKWQAGRGGYCMENNCFFGTVLRSIGFDVYSAGARVKSPSGYGGWSVLLKHTSTHSSYEPKLTIHSLQVPHGKPRNNQPTCLPRRHRFRRRRSNPPHAPPRPKSKHKHIPKRRRTNKLSLSRISAYSNGHTCPSDPPRPH